MESDNVTPATSGVRLWIARLGVRSTATEWIAVALLGQERSCQLPQQEVNYSLLSCCQLWKTTFQAELVNRLNGNATLATIKETPVMPVSTKELIVLGSCYIDVKWGTWYHQPRLTKGRVLGLDQLCPTRGPVQVSAVVEVSYILTTCPYFDYLDFDIFDAGGPQCPFITSVTTAIRIQRLSA